MAQLVPRDYSDVSGLTGGEAVALSFGTPSVSGAMTVGKEVSGVKISIPYFNAKGTEKYTVSATVAGINGLNVAGGEKTLNAGNGTIELDVTGTPDAEGEATFTINGIDGLTDNTVTASVKGEVAGGQDIIWDLSENTFNIPTNKDDAFKNQKYDVNGLEWNTWGTYYGTGYYLMLVGKKVPAEQEKGHVVLPVLTDKAIKTVSVVTGSGASTNVEVALQKEVSGAWQEVLKKKLDTLNVEFVYGIEAPEKGVKYRLIVTNNYNAQFTQIKIVAE